MTSGSIGKRKNSDQPVRIRTQGRPISVALAFATAFALMLLSKENKTTERGYKMNHRVFAEELKRKFAAFEPKKTAMPCFSWPDFEKSLR